MIIVVISGERTWWVGAGRRAGWRMAQNSLLYIVGFFHKENDLVNYMCNYICNSFKLERNGETAHL